MSPSGCLRQGWISLALWISFGLLIEVLIGFRAPALMDDPVRREMFRLAHAHGALLNLVLIAAAICVRLDLTSFTRPSAAALRTSVVLMPAGFLLSGIWHFKNDPGLAIFLVPAGAVLLLFAALMFALSVRRDRGPAA